MLDEPRMAAEWVVTESWGSKPPMAGRGVVCWVWVTDKPPWAAGSVLAGVGVASCWAVTKPNRAGLVIVDWT